jgi:prepilin-type N-terminal cleavage/methylation domain-containing protein
MILMNKEICIPNRRIARNGFSLSEIIITTAIIGTLSSIAYPSYTNANNNAKLADVKAKLLVIPSIIGQHIDETGEVPATWDDLASIAAVMTNNGPATGDLETPITLPNSIYDLAIEGPTESVYTLTATRVIDRNEENSDNEDQSDSNDEFKFAVKSCFNISNGASDLRSGNLSDIENTLNCG